MSAATGLRIDSLRGARRRERSSICTQRPAEPRVDCVPAGSRLTLGQVLDGVWEGLRAGGTAECPICHGQLRGDGDGSAARCEGCGTRIS